MKKRHAFTLIEMLVVIAIIGIIAALVVNMNSGAQAAKRRQLVDTEKNALTLMISDYQAKLNFYPPDNGLLAAQSPGTYYDLLAATNPLIYELTGATNSIASGPNAGNMQFFDGTVTNTANNYSNLFGRASVANANPDEPHDFFSSGPQSKEYADYNTNISLTLYGLLVPVLLTNDPTQFNFWHYDASSTNRHNPQSYDLWAEYLSATKNGISIITTNGNW